MQKNTLSVAVLRHWKNKFEGPASWPFQHQQAGHFRTSKLANSGYHFKISIGDNHFHHLIPGTGSQSIPDQQWSYHWSLLKRVVFPDLQVCLEKAKHAPPIDVVRRCIQDCREQHGSAGGVPHLNSSMILFRKLTWIKTKAHCVHRVDIWWYQLLFFKFEGKKRHGKKPSPT